jgi:hypothetical protein
MHRWLQACEVHDEHGRPVHLTPRQWRRTFATRLINRDVPQEVSGGGGRGNRHLATNGFVPVVVPPARLAHWEPRAARWPLRALVRLRWSVRGASGESVAGNASRFPALIGAISLPMTGFGDWRVS